MSQITRQAVSGAIRKAKLSVAKWEASGMVRGWGEWSGGCRVQQIGKEIRVFHQYGRWAKPSDALEAENARLIAAALDASGIPYFRSDNGLGFVVNRAIPPNE